MKKSLFLFLLFLFIVKIEAQEYFPNNEGVQNHIDLPTAFINAKIYITPTQIINNGTLLIQNGKVMGCGSNIIIPKNAIIKDLKGKFIYPSFIDIYTSFGITTPKRERNFSNSELYDTKRTGFYWNEHIRAEQEALSFFEYDAKNAEDYLKEGFGVVGTHLQDGIMRGSGALIALNNFEDKKRVISNNISNHLSFNRSAQTRQEYPSSLMGSMALIRQVYHDAIWYENGNSNTSDKSLEAVIKNKSLIQIFTTDDKLNSLRAAKIAKEFGLNYVLKGIGNELERIEEIKKTNAKFIIPINFPEAYDVSNVYLANKMELSDLRFWNQAPSNLKVLADNGVVFALTTDKLKKLNSFKTNLLKAIEFGFDKTRALEALTTIPASILNKSNEIGSLKNGTWANFIITSGEIFEEKTILYENWVQGAKYVVNDMSVKDIRGKFALTIGTSSYTMHVTGEPKSPSIEITTKDTLQLKTKVNYSNNKLSFLIKEIDTLKFIRLNSIIENTDSFDGKAVFYDGNESKWEAKRLEAFKEKKDSIKEKVNKLYKIMPVTYPNMAYGNATKPKQASYLFKNTTIWTNEKEGIVNNMDVLVKDGKIATIGKDLKENGAILIDGKGKHLTAGIIDEHSHIAISRGVNEGGHNSSAEVTIEDVVNPEDINIYRNLAGGVTTSQLLHGSANPIGGRSAIVKWKWGEAAEAMLYKDAPKFIKFALGENVKQSNFSINNPSRFPQTRMGVEQVFTDYFQRALEYEKVWKEYHSNPNKNGLKTPRTDVELETLLEIIQKKRFISCHSYVQSEILMLMEVAEKFNFRVNTYTHILEGYKVADKMKKHGVGASTFSDWWAYKFEVNDAIPQNGGIMHRQGLVVAYNSDDAEMSRRLNQEAAKAVKYSNISEEEAWKFVTLNPAKLLHLEDKVGSIKIGKDADLVLWSDNPLSVYAKAEKTMIEGTIYYDSNLDIEKRAAIAKEKNELITQLLHEKNKGMTTQKPKKKDKKHYHCDTLETF